MVCHVLQVLFRPEHAPCHCDPLSAFKYIPALTGDSGLSSGPYGLSVISVSFMDPFSSKCPQPPFPMCSSSLENPLRLHLRLHSHPPCSLSAPFLLIIRFLPLVDKNSKVDLVLSKPCKKTTQTLEDKVPKIESGILLFPLCSTSRSELCPSAMES